MRNPSLLTFMMLLTLGPASLMQAETGCIDNSWHLAKAYDAKEYHLVSCNCPCSRYFRSEDRGRCEKCGHFRDVHPDIFVTTGKNTYKKVQVNKIAATKTTSCTPYRKPQSWRTY